MKGLLLFLLVFGLMIGQSMAAFEYNNNNWTMTTSDNPGDFVVNKSLGNLTAYYMANCTASYALVMSNGKVVDNATVKIHKYQNRSLNAAITSNTVNGIAKFKTGLGTAWMVISKEGYNNLYVATKIKHVPACRHFNVNLEYDCKTKNATVTVTDKGTSVEGITVIVSPMGVANKTNKFGKLIFPAFPADMVFVKVTDGETGQLSVFEINECPLERNTTKNPVPQPTTPTPSITPTTPKTEKREMDIFPVVLSLLVFAIVVFIFLRIVKMRKPYKEKK